MSVADVAAEVEAYRQLEYLRWGDCPDADPDGLITCPHCGVKGRAFYLRPSAQQCRKTRTGSLTPRRVWGCGACRRQFSVLTGTGFAHARIPASVCLGLLHMWIDISEAGRQPTAADVRAEFPDLRHETAYRAWTRIAFAEDEWLRMYRYWATVSP